jgi:hypothetical protein
MSTRPNAGPASFLELERLNPAYMVRDRFNGVRQLIRIAAFSTSRYRSVQRSNKFIDFDALSLCNS